MVEFLPRSQCCIGGAWPKWLELLYWTGAFAVFLAYTVNPLILWTAWRRRFFEKPLNIGSMSLIYAAFIFSCGVGHLIEGILPFFYPNYLFVALWTWQTAFISWLANIALIAWVLRRGVD